MNGVQTFVQWFTDNPLSTVGMLYGVAIAGVILYTYLSSSDVEW